jgi:hypothetical protein
MPDFYFTYGTSEKYPFRGGWSKVTAPSINRALDLFTLIHPNRNGCLNCADYYPEDRFKSTTMFKEGNFGEFEHEHIILEVIKNE